MPATQPRELSNYPPKRICLTASGKLMRPSAVAYVLFLCDRPKPHATPMQVHVHYTYKARPFNYGPGDHGPSCVESNVMPGPQRGGKQLHRQPWHAPLVMAGS